MFTKTLSFLFLHLIAANYSTLKSSYNQICTKLKTNITTSNFIDDYIQQLENQKRFQLINIFCNPNQQKPSYRGLGSNAKQTFNLSKVDEYGCWCYLNKMNTGQGRPVDELDKICQKLHYGYQCIVMDEMEIGNICDPNNVEYDVSFEMIFSFDPLSIPLQYDCSNNNQSCQRNACIVESHFIQTIFTQFLNKSKAVDEYDSNFLHKSGFNVEEKCHVGRVAGPGKNDNVRECCGKYPSRYHYKLSGSHVCCSDGSIKNIGSC